MLHAVLPCVAGEIRFVPPVVTIRREETGYGIRFGLTEAEDELLHGPVFDTLDEALAWVDAADRAREGRLAQPR